MQISKESLQNFINSMCTAFGGVVSYKKMQDEFDNNITIEEYYCKNKRTVVIRTLGDVFRAIVK